jgi:hypothetical protein
MRIESLAHIYRDRMYHHANTQHINTHTSHSYFSYGSPDYVLHLSPEALRLHNEHLKKENKL